MFLGTEGRGQPVQINLKNILAFSIISFTDTYENT